MTMSKRLALALAIALVAGNTALAWGPRAQVAVVRGAVGVLGKESNIPLSTLMKFIEEGAAARPDLSGDNPAQAAADEMVLLRQVKTNAVDPYLAYRYGMLGAMVAELTTPMATARPAYRSLYLNDADQNATSAIIKTAPRVSADDPATLIAIRMGQATDRDPLIEKDYLDGVGFSGLASQALTEDISRSVNTVADVLYTLLRGTMATGGVSRERLQAYHVDAVRYYIQGGHAAEAEGAFSHLADNELLTPEIRRQVADMFFDAGQFERAIQEYQLVVKEDPSRRDVVERIAAYYASIGDKALEDNKLEVAKTAFEAAVDSDRMSAEAQEKLFAANKLIEEREQRLQDARSAIEQAKSLEIEAEQLIAGGRHGEAAGRLRDGLALYDSVTEEFAAERNQARSGSDAVTARLARLDAERTAYALSFSGSGMSQGVQSVVRAKAPELAQDALRDLLEGMTEPEARRLAEQESRQLDLYQP
jgi:tetratricopeptide (TPR) repeat protein